MSTYLEILVSAVSSAVSVGLSAGQLFFSMRGVHQDQELHRKELATSLKLHFQTLSQDLLAAAKEADRDVWEQSNDRFNNLMVLTVLMLGITSSLVTEGSFNASNASQDFELAFLITTSAALAFYFGSLSAAIRATRDMSDLMTERSARLEERIIQLTSKLDGGLSPTMQNLYASRNASSDQGASIAPTASADASNPTTAPVDNDNESRKGDESFDSFVKTEIKWLEDFARHFFLMGTACSMVAMAMLVSTDFSSVGATMFAVISVVGGFIFLLWTCRWTWCAPGRSVRKPDVPNVPTRTELQNEVVGAPREDIPRCEVALPRSFKEALF
jgi:hypothetical protein